MRYITRAHVRALEALAGKPLKLPAPTMAETRRGGRVEAWPLEVVRAAIVAAWITDK